MRHIFISYSHKDKDYVHKLRNALRDKGFNVWIDDLIDYGTPWPQEIENNLDKCIAFIVVMTENSHQSNSVRDEVTRAKRKQKPIFALLLSGDTWLPLEATQYEDVTDENLPSAKFYERLQQITDSTPHLTPEPIPEIRHYSDNDESIQEIRRFVQWLVITKNACDMATLYVQDKIDKNEYNLIANSGLLDKSPMYGPLVYDDERAKLEKADPVIYEPEVVYRKTDNPDGFQIREEVRAVAKYILKDNDSNPLAALYFNWREKQEFTIPRKKELENYRDHLFSAVMKLGGISKIRQTSFNSELRARRWLDYAIIIKSYKTFDELLLGTIYLFFEHFDPFKLKVIIGWKKGDKFLFSIKDYGKPFMTNNIIQEVDYEDEDIKWVMKTTRPKFLHNVLDPGNNYYKIIVPIRLHPTLPVCLGVVTVECNYKPLIQEMVQPLCYLADHFGQIKVQLIDRNPNDNNEWLTSH